MEIEHRYMKVLVFFGNDTENHMAEPVVRELNRHFETKLVVPSGDIERFSGFLNEFQEQIILKKNCQSEDYSWADCFFCFGAPTNSLLSKDKYIFSYNGKTACSEQLYGCDFAFAVGVSRTMDGSSTSASMVVGLPGFVGSLCAGEKKHLLYIDAGYFPFGREGQNQLARMLLGVCAQFPDYKICIKPKWSPKSTDEQMLLPNFGHIYEELNALCPRGLPSNLELLTDERNICELIDESACVVTSCSDDYLKAALRGRPVLVVKGLDSDDTYLLRKKQVEFFYRHAEESGCVVDWQNVNDYLPQGRVCAQEHLKQCFSFFDGAANRMAEVMEFVYQEYLERGCYPNSKEYQYETYREQMKQEVHLDWSDLQGNRRICAIENSAVLNQRTAFNVDWSAYYQQQMVLCQLAGEATGAIRSLQNFQELRNVLTDLRMGYYINRHLPSDDLVDQSYLFYAHDQQKNYGLLLELHQAEEEAHESLNYYAGELYWQFGQEAVAVDSLKKYLQTSMARNYEKYVTDTWSCRASAFGKVLSRAMKQEEDEELIVYLRQFLSFAKCYPGKKYFSYKLMKRLHDYANQRGWTTEAEEIAAFEFFVEQAQKVSDISDVAEKKQEKPRKHGLKKFAGSIKKKLKKYKKSVKKRIWKFIGFCKKKLHKYESLRKLNKSWYDLRRAIGYYNAQEQDVLSFKDLHLGEACFVIGNGPSLTAKDLEDITARGYTCFASNKIYKIYNQTDWRPDYFSCIDREVFNQNLHEILSSTNCPMFLHRDFTTAVERYEKAIGKRKKNLHYMRYYCKDNKEAFYPQAANIISGGTVTFTLLELSWMMGFRKIYLIGCDNTYNAFQNVDASAEVLTSDENTGNDYFSKDYMRPGEIMRIGDLDKATKGYAVAREYIESHGGEIYNATRGGKLEVFKRVDLDELLAQSDINE